MNAAKRFSMFLQILERTFHFISLFRAAKFLNNPQFGSMYGHLIFISAWSFVAVITLGSCGV